MPDPKEENGLPKSFLKDFVPQSQEAENEEAGMLNDFSEKENFGRYKVIKELGRGGMGQVHKVYDPQLRRFVALKLLISGGSAKQSDIERFLREARATAKLHHPNIVAVYDIGNEDNKPFFTMDFVEGDSLKSFAKKSSLTIRQTVAIMTKIGNAIHYAHKQGIIHRDLKPANVMMDKNGEPKVMDFGLAKVAKASRKLSKTGSILGTLQYMPPEQAEGKLKTIDERSDVYSLGAILYEILTGQPPFHGGSSFELLYKVLQKPPIPPTKLKRKVPKDLESICLMCLEKKKEQRYQNAKEFVDDLLCFIQKKPIKARPLTHWEYLLRKKKQIGLVVMPLIIFAAVFWLGLSTGRDSKNKAQKRVHTLPRKITNKSQKQKETTNPVIPRAIDFYWNKNQKYFDFAHEKWEELPVSEQIHITNLYQKWYAKKKGIKVTKTLIIQGVNLEMVLIPPGRYWMGSPTTDDWRYTEYETPRHVVVISKPFWMSKTEITQAQWKAVKGNNPSTFKGSNNPVENVSWDDCKDFCKKVNLQLPSESQWEYACRAGTTTRFYWGKKWDRNKINSASYWLKKDLISEKEWTQFEFLKKLQKRVVPAKTTNAKSFTINGFGLYGMLGNVTEWCEDTYNKNYMTGPTDHKARTKGANSFRILRGPSFLIYAHKCRSAARGWVRADTRNLETGFRVVKNVFKQTTTNDNLNLQKAIKYLNQGLICGEKDDYDGVIANCTKAIKLNPNLANAYYLRGSAYRVKNNYSKALVNLTQAINLDPNSSTAYYVRGSIRANKGNYNGAIADYQKFLQLTPNHSKASATKINLEKLKILENKIPRIFAFHWNEKQQYFDFTHEKWETLPAFSQKHIANSYQKWYAQKKGTKVTKILTIQGVELEMVLIPPGRYWMGSKGNEKNRDNDEGPRHIVTIKKPFWCSKYEITQALWKKVMKNNPSFPTKQLRTNFEDDLKPVGGIRFSDCLQFCQKTGLQMLSEAQWEYACRAGITTRFYWGDEWKQNQVNSISTWLKKDIMTDAEYKKYDLGKKWQKLGARSKRVGSFPPNAFGLYDMAGNIYEWCFDHYHGNYVGAPKDGSAWLGGKKTVGNPLFLLRGGSFIRVSSYCRSANRGALYDTKNIDFGFRVAKQFITSK